jgi:hypothetical protein
MAVFLARTRLVEDHPRGPIPPDDSLLYLDATQEGHCLLRCDGCGTELHGRQQRWCGSCRKNGWRRHDKHRT